MSQPTPVHAPASWSVAHAGPPPWDPWRAASITFGVMSAPLGGAAALARRQEERLRALLEHAARHSPWWRESLRGRDVSRLSLADLPVTSKRTLMARFDDWVTDPALKLDELREFLRDPSLIAAGYLGRYVAWESSGSTGEPAVFVQDTQALAVYDALESLRRPGRMSPARIVSSPWHRHTVAFVGATEGHFASTVSIERLRALNPWMAASVRGVNFLLPPDALAARLEALAPDVLATYPSMAVILAQARLAGRLDISPREVWTGGETLTPPARALVERAFGASVIDAYGCSEFLALACECAEGHLHLNADWALLEALDDEGRPVPAGTPSSRTLLTNLANHVQPVIRYELGDEVVFDPAPCACGSCLPVLRVRGRADESLDLPAGRGRRLLVSPLAVCTVLEDRADLFQFQLAQVGDHRLELRGGGIAGGLLPATDPDALREGARVLREFLAAQGAQGVTVTVKPTACFARGRSGKVPRVSGPAAG